MSSEPLKELDELESENSIAVIGAACLFPEAGNIDQFWQNILAKKESIRFFNPEELSQTGISPVLQLNPNYVPARGVITDVDQFDASFFGYSPYEAQLRILSRGFS